MRHVLYIWIKQAPIDINGSAVMSFYFISADKTETPSRLISSTAWL